MIELLPIRTRLFTPPQDDIGAELHRNIPKLIDGDIVVITSKLVSIHQGRCMKQNGVSKEQLAREWADYHIPAASSRHGISLSIIYGGLIATAGIDESNANGYLIMLPHDPSGFCATVRKELCSRDGVRNLGVIVTDSHCLPFRRGVVSIAIGTAGFLPTHDYRGTPDLFGRLFHVSQTDVADAVAAAAGGVMGEGTESSGVVLVRGWPRVTWSETAKLEDDPISIEEDIFAPLLKPFSPGGGRTRATPVALTK
jgi:F420-0:gamma-glutamyl ligase